MTGQPLCCHIFIFVSTFLQHFSTNDQRQRPKDKRQAGHVAIPKYSFFTFSWRNWMLLDVVIPACVVIFLNSYLFFTVFVLIFYTIDFFSVVSFFVFINITNRISFAYCTLAVMYLMICKK